MSIEIRGVCMSRVIVVLSQSPRFSPFCSMFNSGARSTTHDSQ